jgi:hypothetical protein
MNICILSNISRCLLAILCEDNRKQNTCLVSLLVTIQQFEYCQCTLTFSPVKNTDGNNFSVNADDKSSTQPCLAVRRSNQHFRIAAPPGGQTQIYWCIFRSPRGAGDSQIPLVCRRHGAVHRSAKGEI